MEHTDETRAGQEPAGPPVPVPFGSRLRFAWAAVWAALVSLVLGTCEIVVYHFRPEPRTFKYWAGRWGRVILWGVGVHLSYTQEAPLDPAQSYVFVANHQNAADILALAATLPVPFGFIAKAELASMPIIGACIRHSPSLFVDKSTPRRAVASLQEAGERIRQGTSVLVFAEGARSYAPALLPFQRGAFQLAFEAGVPLVPVTIADGYRVLDERRRWARPGTIHVISHTPIPMAGRRRSELPEIMESIHGLIQSHVAGAPVPEHESGHVG